VTADTMTATVGLTGLADDQLAEMFRTGDAATQAAVLAEMERQDQTAEQERRRRAWRQTQRGQEYAAAEHAWETGAHGEYLTAEAACPVLLSAAGLATGRNPFPMLWTCSADEFSRWASDDFRRWVEHGELTVTTRGEFLRGTFWAKHSDNPWHEEPGETATVAPSAEELEAAEDAAVAARREERARKAEASRRRQQERAAAEAAEDAAAEEREARRAERDREREERRLQREARSASASVAVMAPSAVIPAAAAGIAPRRAEVDGARLLEQCGLFLLDYASFPSPAAAVACTLWAGHAVARDASRDLIWRASPRLLLTSAEPGSGKSTVLDLLAILCRSRAGRLGTVTAPGLVQLLGQLREPAFPDEVQSTFGNGRRAEEVRRIINAGYTRRAAALTGRGAKASLTNVFGPVAMAGLDSLITDTNGRLTDTLARCIIIRMERPARRMPELDERGEDRGDAIAAALAGWTAAIQGELRATAQGLADAAAAGEDGLEDIGDGGRVAQIWRPLLAIADVAGGMWSAAARDAVWELSAAAGDLEATADAMDLLEAETAGRSFFTAAGTG
jgi:hypothetical protein